MKPEKRKSETEPEKSKPFSGFALPAIRAAYPKLTVQNLVGVQPMTGYILPYGAYFVKRDAADDDWETCSSSDIANPSYEPHFVLFDKDGFVVYNNESPPIEVDEIRTIEEPWVFSGKGAHRKYSIFYMNYEISSPE